MIMVATLLLLGSNPACACGAQGWGQRPADGDGGSKTIRVVSRDGWHILPSCSHDCRHGAITDTRVDVYLYTIAYLFAGSTQ
jgi:hypothetical protein